jgi:hypothetical protein
LRPSKTQYLNVIAKYPILAALIPDLFDTGPNLQGKKKTLGPNHISTLAVVNNLGNLYKKQGKLVEAETMFSRALQGYEVALDPELVLSYLPALNIMFAFGGLFSLTDQKGIAKATYDLALSGFITVHGPPQNDVECSKVGHKNYDLRRLRPRLNICPPRLDHLGKISFTVNFP